VPSPTAPTIDRDRIYFARRDLPPIGVHINDMPRADADATSRIAHRISALLIDDTVTPPPDAFTARPARGTVTAVGDVKVTSDTVRIDLGVPTANGDWNVPDLDAVPLRQQIVYTATEEAGIRYVIVTQNGGQPARIGSFSLGSPISREDVSGYPRVSQQLMGESWPAECGPTPCPTVATARLSNSYSVDAVGRGVARFEVRIESGQTTGSVNLDIRQGDERKSPWAGKYILELDVRGADPKQGVEIVDRAPLRSVRTGGLGDVATYELALDDLRPWRVVITGEMRARFRIRGKPDLRSAPFFICSASSESALEFWRLHSEVDVEHSQLSMDILTKYCTTKELQEDCINAMITYLKIHRVMRDAVYLEYVVLGRNLPEGSQAR